MNSLLNRKNVGAEHDALAQAKGDVCLDQMVHDEDLWCQILRHDLSVVTGTFAKRNPKYAGDAEALETECKRFLYLATVAMNLDMAPTKPIDEYWHQFILFTEEYEAFCHKYAGAFMHHRPLVGPDHEAIFKRTQRLAAKIFGGDFNGIEWWHLPMSATSCGRMVSRAR